MNKEELNRVRSAIKGSILEFLPGAGEEFHVEALRKYVADRHQVAPASPDRVLRSLRQDGVIDYEVVSRRQSLYRVL